MELHYQAALPENVAIIVRSVLTTSQVSVLTAAEIATECATTLKGYDQNGDDQVSASERDTPGAGRSAIG